MRQKENRLPYELGSRERVLVIDAPGLEENAHAEFNVTRAVELTVQHTKG